MENRLFYCKKAEMAVHILLCLVMTIYPLLLFKKDLGGISSQSLVLFLAVMGTLFYCFLLIRKEGWKLPPFHSRIDLMMLLLSVYAFIRIIVKMTGTATAEGVSFDFEVTMLSVSVLYLLLAEGKAWKEEYFDILVFSGLIVFALLLIKFLCTDRINSALEVLDRNGIASYTILICMAGLWQYIRCRDRLRSFFYIGVLAIGYFVLFINHNRVSILLMSFIFIVIPVVVRPTAELVKRDMQMFFLYLFMLSNMCLITNYTDLIRVETDFSLEQSVYLELFIAIGGVVFFRYWDRIPEGMDPDRLVMRKMRKAYQFLFNMLIFLFTGVLIGGNKWQSLPEKSGITVVKGFVIPVMEEIQNGKGGIFLCVEELGALGTGILVILFLLAIAGVRKRIGFDKPVTTMLVIFFFMFVTQFLFWGVSSSTLPVYLILSFFALKYKEERQKIKSIRLYENRNWETN